VKVIPKKESSLLTAIDIWVRASESAKIITAAAVVPEKQVHSS